VRGLRGGGLRVWVAGFAAGQTRFSSGTGTSRASPGFPGLRTFDRRGGGRACRCRCRAIAATAVAAALRNGDVLFGAVVVNLWRWWHSTVREEVPSRKTNAFSRVVFTASVGDGRGRPDYATSVRQEPAPSPRPRPRR